MQCSVFSANLVLLAAENEENLKRSIYFLRFNLIVQRSQSEFALNQFIKLTNVDSLARCESASYRLHSERLIILE